MSSTSNTQFLTVSQAAEALGVSRSTAYLLVREGALPAIRLRGSIRVPAGALSHWLADREAEALAAVKGG